MRPDTNDVIGARALPVTEYRQVTVPEDERRARGVPPRPSPSSQPPQPPQSSRSPRSGREMRLDERLRRLLGQKRGPDTVMLTALSVALLCGLIGFAVHFLWIFAVIVMALALGFVIADSRRNRIDIADQRDEVQNG